MPVVLTTEEVSRRRRFPRLGDSTSDTAAPHANDANPNPHLIVQMPRDEGWWIIIVPSWICLKLQTSRRRDMGRPIGSLNRQKPFAGALRFEICAGNDDRHLRAIARKLIEMAEGGDLQAIKDGRG
jgi:hypothetical protein